MTTTAFKNKDSHSQYDYPINTENRLMRDKDIPIRHNSCPAIISHSLRLNLMKPLKTTILLISSISLMSACRHKDYYTCQCNNADSAMLHVIGYNSKDNAYALCKAYQDSITTCNMWVQ